MDKSLKHHHPEPDDTQENKPDTSTEGQCARQLAFHESSHFENQGPSETADSIIDDRQETEEDSSAAEETAAKWEAVPAGEEQIPASFTPPQRLQKNVDRSLPLQSPADDRRNVSLEAHESSGESADVVRDASQTGADHTAETAEERSIKQHASEDQEPTQ